MTGIFHDTKKIEEMKIFWGEGLTKRREDVKLNSQGGCTMNKVALTVRVSPEERREIKKLAAELDMSIQDLLLKGYRLFKSQHEKKRSSSK